MKKKALPPLGPLQIIVGLLQLPDIGREAVLDGPDVLQLFLQAVHSSLQGRGLHPESLLRGEKIQL